MVADPEQIESIRRALGIGAGGEREEEPRYRSQRLVSVATMEAVRSKCKCLACKYLRRAVDISMEEAAKELKPDAERDDSKA